MTDSELRSGTAAFLLVSILLTLPFHTFAGETREAKALPENPGSNVSELSAGAKSDDEELPAEGETAGQADEATDYSNLVSYDCGKGRIIQIHYIAQGVEEYALVIVDGNTRGKLDIVPSGSGVRYANQNLEWHTKAKQGLLTRKGRVLDCAELSAEPNQPSETGQKEPTK